MELTKVRLTGLPIGEDNPPAVLKVVGNRNQIRLALQIINDGFGEHVLGIERADISKDKLEQVLETLNEMKAQIDDADSGLRDLLRTL